MQYIVVRHRYRPNMVLNGEPHLTFIDAVLVENAESDAVALKAAGIERPQARATAWEIIPVPAPIDATGVTV